MTTHPCAARAIQLADYINAADISAADAPHVVVEKLQKALDAACTHAPAQAAQVDEMAKMHFTNREICTNPASHAPATGGTPDDPALAMGKLFPKLDDEDMDTLNWLLKAARESGRMDGALSARQQGVCVPRELVDFLSGSGALEGVWFGDPHPTERGQFWWRKYLRPNLKYDKATRTIVAAPSAQPNAAPVADEFQQKIDALCDREANP